MWRVDMARCGTVCETVEIYFSQGGSYDGYNLGYNPCYNLYNLGYNRDKHLISSIPGDRCYKNLWNLC